RCVFCQIRANSMNSNIPMRIIIIGWFHQDGFIMDNVSIFYPANAYLTNAVPGWGGSFKVDCGEGHGRFLWG
ncbi:MAG TPA: hypothetical protein PKA44_07910, partial [Saprospiraceae bacterium]|nr:hypothetical protein [Saprospiraceae bacterium]